MTSDELEWEFSMLLSQPGGGEESAPSSLKARLYSALVHEQQRSGPLASLEATAEEGRGLCVFEKLVQIAPVAESIKKPFFCSVCHARVLAEHFDHAPIFWVNCPYVGFKKS